MLRVIVGDFADLSATLATRIGTVTAVETGRHIDVTSPDQIALAGTLRSGAAASAHIMTGGPSGDGFRIDLHGRAGRLVLAAADTSLVAPRLTVLLDDGSGRTTQHVPDRLRHAPADGDAAVANVREVYRDLASAVRGGGAGGPDLTTAVQVHRLLDAIRRSSETGRRQPVA